MQIIKKSKISNLMNITIKFSFEILTPESEGIPHSEENFNKNKSPIKVVRKINFKIEAE